MQKKKKHKWKYQVNIKKKILVLVVLGVFLFIGLGYSILGSNLGIFGTLTFASPHVTVTLDANGGSGTPTTINRIIGNTYGTITEPTRTGYTFQGWITSNLLDYDVLTQTAREHGIVVNDGIVSDVTPDSDSRLWDYSSSNWTMYLPSGTYTLTVYFDQRALNPSAQQFSEIMIIDKNNTWIARSYDYNNGERLYDIDEQSLTFTLTSGMDIGILAKAYDGQYKIKLEEGSTPTEWEQHYITSDTKVTKKENHTLTAKWKGNEYTVSFNTNGGSGGQSANVTATYGSAMPAINTTAPTRTNCTFAGWSTNLNGGTKYYNANGTSAKAYDVTSDTTLYAQWIPVVGSYFTMPSLKTNATSEYLNVEQQVSTSHQDLWRVINITSDGEIEAISEYVSVDLVRFGAQTPNVGVTSQNDNSGRIDYILYVKHLQNFASAYGIPELVKSSREFGYDGQSLEAGPTTIFEQTSPPTNGVWTQSTPDPTTGTGGEEPPATTGTPANGGGLYGDTLYLRDYQLVSSVYSSDPTTYGTTGLKAYDRNGTARAYWIASRSYSYDTSYYRFRIRRIDTDGNLATGSIIWASGGRWYSKAEEAGIRPIVTLYSEARLKPTGTGTKTDPFMF